MPQYKSKDNQGTYPLRCGRKLITGKVVNAILDSSRGINNRYFVIVSLNDGAKFNFPVPTTQEIRDRFFYKKAKTQPDKPARPPNKFFIFRTMFQGAIDDFKLQVPIVSGLASEVWKKCSPEVVELFTKLSQIAKSEHGEINPGYVYKPNRNKSRIMKNTTNSHIQEKSDQNINDSSNLSLNDSLSNAPVSTSSSKLNYFDPQDHVPLQVNLNSDENSYMIDNSITTPQNIQAISTHYTYLDAINSSIHGIASPLETLDPLEPLEIIHDPYQQQFYQYPMNNLFYSNNDLPLDQFNTFNTSYDQDVNDLIQPQLISIPYQSMYYLPTKMENIIESKDLALSSGPSSLCVEPIQESGCIDYSPDQYTIFQNLAMIV
ncbi:hypothetical protein C1645_769258 [Glomus cerebriforme]|uniref:HMG box domain-containing protein n=1 Tax=Glomus cerebriforme TaxID=658196 RepID=A0A397T1J3_9GLOM|nr:hypothetical protein C1645_769258 [Glomus cerebriforme]